MRYILVIFFIMFFCGNSYSQDSWMNLIDNDDIYVDLKEKSLDFKDVESEDPLATAIGRTKDKKTNTVNFYIYSIKLRDCANEHGVIIATGLDGDFVFKSDFVFQGGNVASYISEVICISAKQIIMKSAETSQ